MAVGRWRVMAGLTSASAVACLVGACALVDPDEARICRRALPAIEPEGSTIAIEATGALSGGGVRIDYEGSRSDGGRAVHFAECRFEVGAAGRLRSIRTDRGEIEGARLYLLQHYYVETLEGLAGEPRTAGPEGLPEIPRAAAVLLQHALVGLPGLAIYGLLAAAYGLLYGLVGRINLAFGAIAAVGAAAIGVVVAALARPGDPTASILGIAMGLPVAVAAAAIHAGVAGTASFVAVPARRGQASLIATVGAAIVLAEWLRLVGPRVPDWVPPIGADAVPLAKAGAFVVTLTPIALLTAAAGAAAAAALVGVMARSRFGRDWRALADDRLGAALCGVDGAAVFRVTALLSGGLAGLAGALAAVQFGALGTSYGFTLGLKALAAAVIGGLGSIRGALLGGLAIGTFEILWSAYGPIASRDLALEVVLVGAIVLRAGGLVPDMTFAWRDPEP